MRTITLEEHFVTASFRRAIGDAPGPIAALEPKLLDLGAGRIAAMDEGGIDLQVLSLASMGFDALPSETATPLARDINDELAGAIAAHPTRFAGFATLALKDPAAAAKELERAVRTLGFVGAMLDGTTSTEGAPALTRATSSGSPDSDAASLFLDDPRFTPVWEAAAALDVPIYLHPAPPPAAIRQAYFSGMQQELAAQLLSIAGWQWHAETALHTLRLILCGLFDRLPQLQLILGHMGEGLPYALARSSGILTPAAKQLRRPVADYFQSNIHLTTSGYFTLPPLRCALDVVGLDRMMFSVDYPFSPNTRGREFLDAIAALLPPEDLERLAHGNAERLLRLPGAVSSS
jgi:predicted TIM-barrel fold metal-dependent hydrolase